MFPILAIAPTSVTERYCGDSRTRAQGWRETRRRRRRLQSSRSTRDVPRPRDARPPPVGRSDRALERRVREAEVKQQKNIKTVRVCFGS